MTAMREKNDQGDDVKEVVSKYAEIISQCSIRNCTILQSIAGEGEEAHDTGLPVSCVAGEETSVEQL